MVRRHRHHPGADRRRRDRSCSPPGRPAPTTPGYVVPRPPRPAARSVSTWLATFSARRSTDRPTSHRQASTNRSSPADSAASLSTWTAPISCRHANSRRRPATTTSPPGPASSAGSPPATPTACHRRGIASLSAGARSTAAKVLATPPTRSTPCSTTATRWPRPNAASRRSRSGSTRGSASATPTRRHATASCWTCSSPSGPSWKPRSCDCSPPVPPRQRLPRDRPGRLPAAPAAHPRTLRAHADLRPSHRSHR